MVGQRSKKVLSGLRTNARCPTELDVSWTYFPKAPSVQLEGDTRATDCAGARRAKNVHCDTQLAEASASHRSD